MKRALSSLVFCLLGFSRPLWADEDGGQAFDLSELPPGVMVTLPHPAETSAPLAMHLRLQASDRAQVLKLSVAASKSSQRVRLAIYDQESTGVQRLTLNPGAAAVYHFKSLRPIRIVPEVAKGGGGEQRLILESNRPLGVSHGEAGQALD